ncbi:MAG: phage terminase large subunit [Candidatus Omnitrophota bacterium]
MPRSLQVASELNTLSQLRRKMGEKSVLAFAQTYFPRHAAYNPCTFHHEICGLLQEMSEKRSGRLAVAAPRAHAKSTVVSFFYVMWSICYSKERCILILSATAKQAQQLLSGVSVALDTNTLLQEDFPEVFAPETKARTKWTQDQIVTPNNIMVAALGVGQESRGFKHDADRPTLIILDDVDGEKNTFNSDSRDKVLRWFTGFVLKAGAPKTCNFVAVGTLLHRDSLLSRLTRVGEFLDWEKRIYKAVIKFSARTDLWERWKNILFGNGEVYEDEAGFAAANKFFEANKQDMLEGTKVLWEEVENYYALIKIKELESSYSFDAEKQNDPSNAKECRFNPDTFTYWDREYGQSVDELLASFKGDYTIIGALDPSVGTMKTKNDPSAIVILAKHQGKLYVLDADIKMRPQEEIIEAVVNYCKIRKPISKFIVEANTCPGLLLKNIQDRAHQENVVGAFKEIRTTKNKDFRIFGMETHITTGQVVFSYKHTELLDQLKYYPRGDHDDGPDALEMALREAVADGVGFVDLTVIRDKHGRDINHRDYGQTTPAEDCRDEDDDDDGPARPFYRLD